MEIRTKMIDINYDEIWIRYKNEAETFKYLDRIQKEEGDAEIALYKWILYLAYGGECYNYTCNDGTFEEAVRRIYEAVYRHRFLKTRMADSLSCYSEYLKVMNKIKNLEKTAKNINNKLDNMEVEWDYSTKGNIIEIQAV